jgi:hypothetical protein
VNRLSALYYCHIVTDETNTSLATQTILEREVYDTSLFGRLFFGFVYSFVALICVFVFRDLIGIAVTVIVWLIVTWLFFFRTKRITIQSDGRLELETFFRFHKRGLNLLELRSIEIKIWQRTYACTLIDAQGNSLKFGMNGWQDAARLRASLDSAAKSKGTTYLGRTQEFFDNSGKLDIFGRK